MARPHSLKVTETVRRDGTTKFSTRLMVDGERVTIDLGDERDGATPLSAARKLKDVLEDIRLGRWEPPTEGKTPKREPGFAEAARMYLEVKRSRQLRSSTMNRLTWAFETHLIPFLISPSSMRTPRMIGSLRRSPRFPESSARVARGTRRGPM